MDQINEILITLQGHAEQATQALNPEPKETLQIMITSVKDCFHNGQIASEHLAKLMTHPVVVSFLIGVALGHMISQKITNLWKNEDQVVEEHQWLIQMLNDVAQLMNYSSYQTKIIIMSVVYFFCRFNV